MILQRITPQEPPKLTDSPKSAGVKSAGIIRGYALKWNTVYSLGWHSEKIAPGALMGADLSDIRCLFNHDTSLILGRNAAGTLKTKIDGIGFWYECTRPDSPNGVNVREAVRRGDISQSSWSFVLKSDTWEKPIGKAPIRVLTGIKAVFDVSPVTYPANPAATVTMPPTYDSGEARKSFEAWQSKQQGKSAAPSPRITQGDPFWALDYYV